MVRLFIRNGACGVEEFFKLVSSESKVAVFLAVYKKDSVTFKELKELFGDTMEASVVAKRLSEFFAAGILDKLVYNQSSGSQAVYRITQKAIDIVPAFDMMHSFCSQWLQVESNDAFEWVTYTKKLLGSRWNARIIWLLFVLRTMRFNELKNSIEGISFKMLTQQLRCLESEGVVLRTDFEENPPHIEYSLTEKGEALYRILLLVSFWNAKYDPQRAPDENDDTRCAVNLSI